MDAESTTGQQSAGDHQLAVEIDRLRVDFTETQDLYREVEGRPGLRKFWQKIL